MLGDNDVGSLSVYAELYTGLSLSSTIAEYVLQPKE